MTSQGTRDVQNPELNNISSNLKLSELVDMNTGLESPGILLLKNGQDIRDIQDQELEQLLDEYQDVFCKELPESLPPKRAVDHEINM